MYKQKDNVLYRALDGNLYKAIILYRKIDFENDVINTENAVGNFDYLISYQFKGKVMVSFCQEEDLTNQP